MEFFDDLFEKNNPERPNLFERCELPVNKLTGFPG